MSHPLLRSAPQQFLDCASWKENISNTFVPLEVSAADPKRFRSSVAVDSLGWMQVCEMRTGAQRVRVLVGPEGGFSDREIAAAVDLGARPIGFPTPVLRTPTAVALVAALGAMLVTTKS